MIDGIRVNTKKGWWLIRASNTQPALIVRCEAESKSNLNNLILEVKHLLDKYDIKNNCNLSIKLHLIKLIIYYIHGQ